MKSKHKKKQRQLSSWKKTDKPRAEEQEKQTESNGLLKNMKYSATYVFPLSVVVAVLAAGLSAYFCPDHVAKLADIVVTAVKQKYQTYYAQPEVKADYKHRELLRPYAFNYTEALEQRLQAMKKYSYPYLLDGVDKRSGLSLEEFRDVYDGKWPVIVTDVVPTWPAFNWTEEYFMTNHGLDRVTMSTNVNTQGSGFSLPMELFIEHINKSEERAWTYLQDEIFLIQRPQLRAQILDTIYTEEDFFRLFPKEIRPWDAFFLWGTAFSRSTLHIDPYNWTGTNAVISGLKRWKLAPPGQDMHLSVRDAKPCGFPLGCFKYNSVYDAHVPVGKAKKKLQKVKFLEVDHLPGEMLFIPTGWFHQAYNVVPTMAVSGEIMNRNNYKAVLEEIFKFGSVKRAVLPKDVDKFTPAELVKFVMSKVPPNILREGKMWTQHILDQMKRDDERARIAEEKQKEEEERRKRLS